MKKTRAWTGLALDAYFDGYKGLLDLLNMMASVCGICMEVVTPSPGSYGTKLVRS